MFRLEIIDFLKLVLRDDAHVGIAPFLPHGHLLPHEAALAKAIDGLVDVLGVDSSGASVDVAILGRGQVGSEGALVAELFVFDLIWVTVLFLGSWLRQ